MQQDLKNIFSNKTSFLVICSSADEDSISSTIILAHVLRGNGKSVRAIYYKQIPETEKFLPLIDELEIISPLDIDYSQYEVVIALDAGEMGRIVGPEHARDFSFPDRIISISIDHHAGHTNFTQYLICDPLASSTIEVLYPLFVNPIGNVEPYFKYNLTPDEATLMLFGIVEDTNFFKWNVTPACLRIAAELVEAGADSYYITNYLAFNKDPRSIAFSLFCLSHIEFFPEIRCMMVVLKQDELHDAGITVEEADEFISSYYNHIFARSYIGFDYSIVLLEVSTDSVRGSFRGNAYLNKIDLPLLAKGLDDHGGGHFNAAGAFANHTTIDVAREKILQKARELYNEKY